VRFTRKRAEDAAAAELLKLCHDDPRQLTGKMVADAAQAGNPIASGVMDRACQALGWGIAQVITLLAIEVVIVGGGVSLAGDAVFFAPSPPHVGRYVFPPLRNSYANCPRSSAKRSSFKEPWPWPRTAYASTAR
jgi:glucokinase